MVIAVAGVAGAAFGNVFGSGKGGGALLRCPGGMERLSHVLDEDIPVFPGDPQPQIDVIFTVEDDGFLVESITNGTHAGTHIDAPNHFVAGGRSIDEIEAEELAWPSYVIDVRDRVAVDPDFQLSWREIRAYERAHGRIPRGAMVILHTGFDALFDTDPDAYANGIAPGFSGRAVQRMFDRRRIGGIGSDYFGPDATNDSLFDATFTALSNDGLVLTNLANLDALSVRGDVIIAPAVRLVDGSGYQVDPIACLGRGRGR